MERTMGEYTSTAGAVRDGVCVWVGEGAGVVRDAASHGVDGDGIAGLAPGWLVPIDGDLGGYCRAQHCAGVFSHVSFTYF